MVSLVSRADDIADDRAFHVMRSFLNRNGCGMDIVYHIPRIVSRMAYDLLEDAVEVFNDAERRRKTTKNQSFQTGWGVTI